VDAIKDNIEAYDFGILITTDEEVGGRNGTNIAVGKGLRPKVTIVPDGGENWQIETFAKGVQWIKLATTGKSAHASRPWEGSSAISSLLAALHDIRELLPETSSREATSLSISTIEGGETGNQIPAHASALLDIRYGSIDDYKRIPDHIHQICQNHGIHEALLVSDPPCTNDINNPLIASFQHIVSKVVGTKPSTTYNYGTTDGRYFSAVGVPTIIIAPESGGRHTDTEWLSAKSYAQFTTVIEQYVKQTASRHRQPIKKPVPTEEQLYA
jgi:acetylornithine deacetylase/succinyl-diaminopimelate desuccinylase-like protein